MDIDKLLKDMGVNITYRCNKGCYHCALRRDVKGWFDQMTLDEYKGLFEHIDGSDIPKIKQWCISGGEPFLHKDIIEIIEFTKKMLPDAKILVITNGSLIDKFVEHAKDNVYYRISTYPGYNDAIIEKHKASPNILTYPFYGFFDAYATQNRNDTDAKKLYRACGNKWLRFTGTRLYECCNSEMMERLFNIDNVSFEFADDWKIKLEKLETWKACKRCYKTSNYSKIKKTVGLPKKHSVEAN